MPDFDYPTSSPAAGLAAGLARGIFGYRARQKAEEQKRLDQQRDQSLKFLSGLIDQVEPESQPVLLQQIGNVMGLKGKERSLWDRLTGSGLANDREAIQQMTSGVLGSLIGPKRAQELRGGPIKTEAQEPTIMGRTPYGNFGLRVPELQVGERPNLLPEDSIVLRDPRTERLDDLKAQYGLQFSQRAALQRAKEQDIAERQLRLQEDRQAFDIEKQQRLFDLKARAEVDKRAFAIARSNGYAQTHFEHSIQAAEEIAAAYGINAETLKARLGLIQAKTREADAMLATGGLTAGQQATERRAVYDDALRAYREWGNNVEIANNAGREYRARNVRLQQLAKESGGTYDTETGTFNPPTIGIGIRVRNRGLVEEEQKFKKMEAEAKGKVKSSSDQLRSPYYSGYVQVGNDEWDVRFTDDPRAGGGIIRAPSPAPGPYPKEEPPKIMMNVGPTSKGNIWIGRFRPRLLKKGERILDNGSGRLVEVLEVLPRDETGQVRYRFRAVR